MGFLVLGRAFIGNPSARDPLLKCNRVERKWEAAFLQRQYKRVRKNDIQMRRVNKMTKSNSDIMDLGLTSDRVETLTDGIFAIAMTLLVLNIHLPELGTSHQPELYALVIEQSRLFYNYALSFILLAIFWIIHHQQFHYIKRTDRRHIWLNIFILMFVCLMPFSTSLSGDYHGDWMAGLFFGSNMFILGVLFYLNWTYATKDHRLVDRDLDSHRIAIGKRRGAVTPLVSLLAMALSFIIPTMASYSYILIVVILYHPYFRHIPE